MRPQSFSIHTIVSILPLALVLTACGSDANDSDSITIISPGDAGESRAESSGQTGGGRHSDTGSDDAADNTPIVRDDAGVGPDTTGSSSTDANSMTDSGGGEMPTAKVVDPQCVDGKYSETFPNPNADIALATQNYRPSQRRSFILNVLDKRYPVGKWIVRGGLNNYDRTNCVQAFTRNRASSASQLLNAISTVVHECGHLFDRGTSGRNSSRYAFTPQTTMTCSGGDSRSRGGETFARSRIRGDKFQNEHPPCNGDSGRNCDSYADTYLDGDPDNGNFEGGDQGFNMLLEEAVQYVNSLATSYAFKDHIPQRRSTSALDGILTFLWYTERYLRMARLEYPRAYAKLSEDPCWRKAILTTWGRAWWIIQKTKGFDELGIADQKLLRLVKEPGLLEEIDRIRHAHGCP